MDTFRAAPVVRVLSAVVTGAYRLALVFGALLLIAVPALELFADTETLVCCPDCLTVLPLSSLLGDA